MREDVAAFFASHPLGAAVVDRALVLLADVPDVEVRVTRSQVALRRRHGFAYVWLPGQYLRNPSAEVVLSVALGRELESARFAEVVRVSPRHWMHHLEVRGLDDLDDEVRAWLHEAAERAG